MITRVLSLLVLAGVAPLLQGCFAAAAVGVGAAAMIAEDRRTTGIYFEDQNIELKVRSAISDKYGKDENVDVNAISFNRFLLLLGEAPSEEVKKDIGATALGVENVRNVQNEISVGPKASVSQRSTDSLTTSKVKSRFLTENKFQVNYVKVATRRDAVYLMGLVTAKEAEDATELARTTGGVQKVVRVFEITENP
jgi:osmotically-inducible protein OsmY